ncbi:MAG: hypothetical protein CFH10_00686 [Alphaproteobacteria bacterium MarineAlpha4_Bin2]|nr:MAG: hypothetical protein CFH10_00686 [Alphaproteobacteria bacterium MarineAlpha4_Bin2]
MDLGIASETVLIIALAFLVAGLVKGVIGGGLPAVAVPIMANAIEPALAASLTFTPVIVTNLWLLFQGGHVGEVIRRYWPFLLTLAAGSAFGAQILVNAPSEAMALAIGTFVVLLSPLPFIPKNWAIPERTQRWLNPVAASGMGIIGGATVMLAPVIVYFVALRIEKNLFVASMGAVALSSMVPLFLSLAANRILAGNEVLLSGLTLIPALTGMGVGIWLRIRISQVWFQRILFVALFVIGVNLIWKSLA